MSELAIKCPYCPWRGKHFTSLGGHISKKHPGNSSVYRIKQETRAKNIESRMILGYAKKLFK